MLIRYKKDLEKIAMGLLSFMPEERDVKKLQDTILQYSSQTDWHLYLWRDDEILGAIGLRIEEESEAIIQHISVNPSYRNQEIGKKMVEEIIQKYSKKYKVSADEMINDFFKKCKEIDNQDDLI